MNDYTRIPSTDTEPTALSFQSIDPDLLNSMLSFDKKENKVKKGQKGKKGKKGKNKLKKKDLMAQLQISQSQVAQQAFVLGAIKRENDMLRRMSDLAVSANHGRLNTGIIESTYEVLKK